ncbi:hypothetical protein [Ferruginibacter sp.]|uniref:hypothetical protein n=1 Tax=Ferruginibacter sp. TaxID=1940288 RepID=UPI002658EACB|nr:hypothetical protein [Ferruginibacter sp.]
MKNCLKNIGILSALTLYCFVVIVYSGIAIGNADAFLKPVSAEQPGCKKAVAAASFFHTTQSDISGAIVNACKTAPFKNTHDEILSGLKAAEQLFSQRFLQYNLYSKNCLIRLQKTALIFPFHYFW